MTSPALTIRNILLLTIGTLSLLVAVFTLQQVVQEWRRLDRIHTLRTATLLGDSLFDAAEVLSQERDVSFFMLHQPDPLEDEEETGDLDRLRKNANTALSTSLAALTGIHDDRIKKRQENILRLEELRGRIDADLKLPIDARDAKLPALWLKESTGIILGTRELWMKYMAQFNNIDPMVALHIRFKFFLGSLTEYAGQERALIGRLLVKDEQATPAQQEKLLRWRGNMELIWSVCNALAAQSGLFPAVEAALKDAESHYDNLYDMMHDLFYSPGAKKEGPYPIDAGFWLELATETTESLFSLKNESLKATHEYVATLEESAKEAIFVRLCVLIVALGLCFICFRVVTRRVLRPIHDMAEALLKTTQGKSVDDMPVPVARNDEIGKLAQVLQALQKTMIDLRRNNIALARTNKELDDFAYIASHDLKEPLRGIHNHASFLLDDNKDKLDAESITRIERLIYLSQRIERLVTDLLHFSRLGRQELELRPTDVGEIVEDIRSTLDEFLKQNNAVVTAAPDMLPVICDETGVTELLRNLVVNAVKYNDSARKIVEVGYLASATMPGGKMATDVYFVKDNGHGIAPEFHEEIFRIFRRIEKGPEGQPEGTGVGLTFVKKIVERHGGKIWLSSVPGQGATFYFTLKDEETVHNDRYAAA